MLVVPYYVLEAYYRLVPHYYKKCFLGMFIKWSDLYYVFVPCHIEYILVHIDELESLPLPVTSVFKIKRKRIRSIEVGGGEGLITVL